VPVYSHGVVCAKAVQVYRAYLRAGKVAGWRCSGAGEVCWQHTGARKTAKTRYVTWWSRTVARPNPQN
jgi:hypothetical protein